MQYKKVTMPDDPRKRMALILGNMVERKLIHKDVAIDMMRKPTVFMDNEDKGFSKWMDGPEGGDRHASLPDFDMFTLLECNYFWDVENIYIKLSNYNQEDFSYDLEMEYTPMRGFKRNKGDSDFIGDVATIGFKTRMKGRVEEGEQAFYELSVCIKNNDNLASKWTAITEHYVDRLSAEENDKLMHAYIGLFTRALYTLETFFYYEHSQDRYAVTESRKNRKPIRSTDKNIKRRLETEASNITRVIYLNRLPSDKEHDISKCRTPSDSKREDGYQRVGFWKTLRHPRFAKHPKYMVERGVRVRSAWIGPKTSTVKGHTYQVLSANKHSITEE